MKRVRYGIYGACFVLMAVAFILILRTPTVPAVDLGTGLPPGEGINLDHEIVLINDALGEEKLLERLADYLRERFVVPVRIQDQAFDVTSAYSADRDQYDVESLVRLWAASVADNTGRLLVVTDKDTFVERLNWTTGCALRGGPAAVMSIHRPRPEFWSRPPDSERLFQRAIRIAAHELGHTWGKGPHCRNDCVMGSTNSIVDIDDLPIDYCGDCRTLARNALGEIRREDSAPCPDCSRRRRLQRRPARIKDN